MASDGRLDDRALRRHAIQIAAQLPESEQDAIQVLRYAFELATGFMEGRRTTSDPVVQLHPIGAR